MTYSIFSNDRQSLQFPVMCDGYLLVDASGAYVTDTTGLWDYQGPFTLEMIITPYEVNGNPIADNENSQKTLPRDALGLAYLSSADRHNVEMCLFHNTNLTLSLVNTTTQAFYQPAEYSLKAEVRINGTTVTVESPTIFTSEIVDDSYSDPTGYIYQKYLPQYKSTGSTVISVNVAGRIVNTTGTFYVGQPVYTDAGLLIGIIEATIPGSSFRVAELFNEPDASSTIYVPVDRDVLYTETSHHVAVSYGNENIYLFYNGVLVASGVHTEAGEFQLDSSDVYLGKRGSGGATTTQFMGELHEVAFYKENRRTFRSINSISPPYRTTLLYFDFEEARL